MTGSFPSDVEVVVVAHNSLATLPDTIDSLRQAGCPFEAITVIDVASTDGTAAWVGAHCPRATVRRLERNDGPNPGRNVGLREARHPFVLLMDSDVLVEPDTVQRLHATMLADRSVKIGSPIVVHLNNPELIQYAGGSVHFIGEAINPWMDRPLSERGRQPADIDAAPGCALLIDRAAALEIGLFDERYFLGKDDGDFLHRMRIAGHVVREAPDAIVRHRSRPRGTWLFYYQIRNRWHFMLKNYEWRTLIGILPCLIVHEPLQFVVLTAKGHAGTYFKAIGGLVAMLPALGRDRAFVRRIRRLHDGAVLKAGRLIVREDLAGGGLARAGKDLYDRFLIGYWGLLRATVLRG